MDKPAVAYSHNGMLLSDKKEKTTDTYNSMNDFQDYWANGARALTYMLCIQ